MASYGFWTSFPNGNYSFSIGSPTEPLYASQFQTFSSVKNIPYISMHGLTIRHMDNGNYVISNKEIKHGDVARLSDEIQKFILTDFDQKFIGTKNSVKKFKITNKNCDLIVLAYIGPDITSLELKDANGNIVHKRKYESKSIFNLKLNASEIMSEYLSHEHHRASLAIHDGGQIRHAADHIPEDVSPLKYWPLHSVQQFVVAPPLLQLQIGE